MNETVAALDELWAAMPIPSGSWHPWVDVIRRLDADVRAALEVAGTDPQVAGELERLVGTAALPPPATRNDRLAEARRLLEELPRPEGRHPYLDVIVPALDAAALLLAAVESSPAARSGFGRAGLELVAS